MEDVLKLYEEPYDPARPVVCMDETNKQLVGETRTPILASPGKPRRIDYEYERRGTADVFLFTEPPTPRKLDGAGEARLIALACGEPPEGRARWTLRLLAGKMVELAIVDGISHETVRRTLKKTS